MRVSKEQAGQNRQRYEDAIAAFAGMAGALMLARAVNDDALSEQILHTTARRMIP